MYLLLPLNAILYFNISFYSFSVTATNIISVPSSHQCNAADILTKFPSSYL